MCRRLFIPVLCAALLSAFACEQEIPSHEDGPAFQPEYTTIRMVASLSSADEGSQAMLVRRCGSKAGVSLYKSSETVRDADGHSVCFLYKDIASVEDESSYRYSAVFPVSSAGSASSYDVHITVPCEQVPEASRPDGKSVLFTAFSNKSYESQPSYLDLDFSQASASGAFLISGFVPDQGERLLAVSVTMEGHRLCGDLLFNALTGDVVPASGDGTSFLHLMTGGLEVPAKNFRLCFSTLPFSLSEGEIISLRFETDKRSFECECPSPGNFSFSPGSDTELPLRVEMPVLEDPDFPEELMNYTVTGRVWYISPSGDDKNGGTSRSDALKTFAKVISLLTPGDQVRVMPGTYEASSSDLARISKNKSGAEGHWTSFVADDPDDKPVLHAGGYGVWNAFVVNASYVALDGLIVCGDNQTIKLQDAYDCAKKYYDTGNFDSKFVAQYNTNGICIGGSGQNSEWPHHVIVRNCVVHDMPGVGIGAIQADYVSIEYNEVYNNAWYCMYGASGISFLTPLAIDSYTGYKLIIRGNRVFNNRTDVPWVRRGSAFDYSDGNGIIVDINDVPQSNGIAPGAGPYKGRTLVENNLSVHNGGSGIHAYRGNHVDIVGNTTYYNGWKYSANNYGEIWNNQSSDVVIYNNIMFARPGGKCNLGSTAPYLNNIFFGGSVQFNGTDCIFANPLFVNLSTDRETADFHLTEGSPAIGHGLTEGHYHFPVSDIEKHSRKGRFDCGAYMYGDL